MNTKITKLFSDLEEDLRLTDLPAFADRVALIRKSLTPVQKKAPVKGAALRLEVTENGKTTEVFFDDEKKAEAFLKLKHKQRMNSHRSPEGLSVPRWDHRWDHREEYHQECADYWRASEEQNLTFTVKIKRA